MLRYSLGIFALTFTLVEIFSSGTLAGSIFEMTQDALVVRQRADEPKSLVSTFLAFETITIRMAFSHLILLLIAGAYLATAFSPTTKVHAFSARANSSPTALSSVVTADDMETARTAFYIWFFGASGGAGIARSSFPRMWNNFQTVRSLKGVGPTQGGEKLGISPLCGYPEDLSRKDVERIVNKKMTVEQIVDKHPVKGNFLAESG